MKAAVYKKLMKLIGRKANEVPPLEPKLSYIDPAHVMIVNWCEDGHGNDVLPDDQQRNFDLVRKITGSDEAVRVVLPLDYVKKAIDTFTGDSVWIRLFTDYPLQMLGRCDSGELEVLIAPRIPYVDEEREIERRFQE